MAVVQRIPRWVAFSACFTVGAALLSLAAPAQTSAPIPTISLAEAIQKAQANEPAFAASAGAQKSAAASSYLAKAALLPTVTYHNQVLFTQSNGQTIEGVQAHPQSAPIFIANNTVHEYTSQASIDETIGLKGIADAKAATAESARASAELEIARRGLVSAVVALYYQVADTETKQALLEQALHEARTFTDLTQKREAAREVAHADVIKAMLQQEQRQRDLGDAKVLAEKARLELGVLLFADPRTPYKTEAAAAPAPLPVQADVDRIASANSPEIRAALAALHAANAGVTSAKAGYMPNLVLNFSYGIDAPQFAKRSPQDVPNLGYSISGTLDVPVWNWFSTEKKVKQSEIQRDVAKVQLTAAQRQRIATLQETYDEAQAAHDQLGLLDQSVQLAGESLRLTRLRYESGESTVLEVVDAQNAYLSAETAQADGAVRYQSALAALELQMGTL